MKNRLGVFIVVVAYIVLDVADAQRRRKFCILQFINNFCHLSSSVPTPKNKAKPKSSLEQTLSLENNRFCLKNAHLDTLLGNDVVLMFS